MVAVSVIIPAYLKEERVDACLQSVLKQTLHDIEVIVVWQKGSDKTEEIIKSFKDPRLRLIEQTEKTGIGGAREIGVQVATGEYLGFVDSDDTIDADYYEKLISAAKENNADIVFSKVGTEQKAYMTFEEKYALVSNGAVFDKLFKAEFIRRNNIHFPLNCFYEDNVYLLKAFWFSNKVVTVPDALYHYFEWKRDDNRLAELKKSIPVIAAEYVRFMEENHFNAEQKSLVCSKFISCVGGNLCAEKETYKTLLNIFRDFPELLSSLRKRRRKFLKRRLLHLSFRHGIFNFLGLQFKFEGKL